MAKIGIGLLGGGGDAAEGHILGFQKDARAEVVAIWDVNEAKGRAQAQKRGVPVFCNTPEALLDRDDIQAVVDCTPDHLHVDYSGAALKAGKHVLCEKPMTTRREDAACLVNRVRETGLTFVVGHIWHSTPKMMAVKAAYQAGELGDAFLVEGDYISNLRRYYGPEGRTPWRSDPQNPQDILLGGGCHPFGLMRWALGCEAKQAFAFANHKAEPMLTINDCYLASFQFENGAIGKIIAATSAAGFGPTGGPLVIYATNGTVWGGKLYRNGLVRDFEEENVKNPPVVDDAYHKSYWGEQASHFLDCIEGKAEPRTSVVDGARIVAALTAAIESARTGKPVDIDNDF